MSSGPHLEPVDEAGDADGEPLPAIPKRHPFSRPREYFLGEDPSLLTALVPTCFLSMVLFTRHPATNFIFDEQEALLANPYVRAASDPTSTIGWLQAFKRDFWGLLPDRTIGSYRPLPDLVWRAMWKVGAQNQSAFPHDYLNVLLHGVNGALVVVLVLRWTRDRLTAWLAGGLFVATAVVTEAVSGVVGLADVLGGMGALLALLALELRLPWMPFAVFGASLVGLYSKESALCIVPLVPLAGLLTSQLSHSARPLRWLRASLAGVAAASAFVFYVEARRRLFPVATPAALTVEANAGTSLPHRALTAALRWYAQPMLPRDPLNNPLIKASTPYRVAGALRVYFRGLTQLVWPHPLSGDYSAPQEPVPAHLVFGESVAGAVAMVAPFVVAPSLGLWSWLRGRSSSAVDRLRWVDLAPLVALGMLWIVISYFPVSNIPILLPTVRAERFWYFPAIGSSLILAIGFRKAFDAASRPSRPWGRAAVWAVFAAFMLVQCVAARFHAFDYRNDLVFWDATRHAVPRSAKAHLNYSVMVGARGDLEGRLVANTEALKLAPEWPMASIYQGDTLCRLHRAKEALPYYLKGFELGPNDQSLIALALQCLWDEHELDAESPLRGALQDLADQHAGSWLKYLVDDLIENGEENKGVSPKYRPRGYDQGPKKESD